MTIAIDVEKNQAKEISGLKKIDDATDIRRRILTAFEEAEQSSDPEVRRRVHDQIRDSFFGRSHPGRPQGLGAPPGLTWSPPCD